MYIYLWVHDEDHWCSGVYVTCYELYQLQDLFVSALSIMHQYILCITQEREKNKKKRKDECLMLVRLIE